MEAGLKLHGHTTVKLKRAKSGLVELIHEKKPNAIATSYKQMAVRLLFGSALFGGQTSLELSNLFTADGSAVGGGEAGKDGIAVGNDTNIVRSGNGNWLSCITTITNSDAGGATSGTPEDTTVTFRGEIQFASAFDVYWIILGIDYSGFDANHGTLTEPFDIAIATQAFSISNNPIEAAANDTLIVDWTINAGV